MRERERERREEREAKLPHVKLNSCETSSKSENFRVNFKRYLVFRGISDVFYCAFQVRMISWEFHMKFTISVPSDQTECVL